MSRTETTRSRAAAALAALAARRRPRSPPRAPAAAAASGHGEAVIIAAEHGKGRTLSGQGVKIVAGPGAKRRRRC